MVTVYALRLDDKLEKSQYEMLLSQEEPARRERISRYRRCEDRWRALCGDALSKYVLYCEAGLSMDKIVIVRNPYGKPMLPADCKFHFNISHSGSWVVCALAKQPVGVDVEHIESMDEELVARFFHPKEQTYLKALKGAARDEAFCELWTLKESYIKCIGTGLSMSMQSFGFIRSKDGYVQCAGQPMEVVQHLPLDKAYRLAVCAQDADISSIVRMVEIATLCGCDMKNKESG